MSIILHQYYNYKLVRVVVVKSPNENPSAITMEDVNWNKKSLIKMLETALFDCAINETNCSVDGGQGICTPFSSPPRGIWQLKSPHPREFAIQGKKNANARGSAGRGGGAGRSRNWVIHKSSIGFELCATTPNNTQQHATGCANVRNV